MKGGDRMELCSKEHDEVAYESGRPCPACEIVSEVKELQSMADDLQDEIKRLENK